MFIPTRCGQVSTVDEQQGRSVLIGAATFVNHFEQLACSPIKITAMGMVSAGMRASWRFRRIVTSTKDEAVGHRPAWMTTGWSRNQTGPRCHRSLEGSAGRTRRHRDPRPGPGEVVVAVQACGVCHTDLTYREGGINDEFPFLLGHEAAGVVESVGAWRRRGGTGRLRGAELARGLRTVPGLQARPPQYCFDTFNATQKMTSPTAPSSPRRWASAPSPTRPWSTRASAPRSSRAPTRQWRGCSAAV